MLFYIDPNLERAIAKKKALNALLPEVHASIQLTEDVRLTRFHNQEIQLLWNNGSREIGTVLALDCLERGHWGLGMAEGEPINSTAVRRCMDALHNCVYPGQRQITVSS